MKILAAERVGTHHAVKRCLYEITNLLLPAHNHAENAGHHAPYGNRSETLHLHVAPKKRSVVDGQRPGKIDAHQIVFLRPKIRGVGQIVVGGQRLCLADAAQDFLLGLRINPDSPLVLRVRHLRHLIDEPVNVFSLTPGVGAYIDALHIVPVQKPLHDVELLLHIADDLILPSLGQKRQGLRFPLLKRRVVHLRIAHGNQVSHAPGHHAPVALQIPVLPRKILMQRLCKLLRHAWFFRDVQLLHSRFLSSLRVLLLYHSRRRKTIAKRPPFVREVFPEKCFLITRTADTCRSDP